MPLIFAVMLMSWSFALAAENEMLSVAVFDFTSNAGQALPRDITAIVTANLSTNSHFVMVERAQINKALSEQAFGLSGEINSDAAAKVGQLTGAKVLVAGRAIRLGKQLVVIANIIGAETGRVYSQKVQGHNDKMLALLSDLSDQVAATIRAQSTNLVGKISVSHQLKLDAITDKLKGKHLPSVSVQIRERIQGERGPHQTAQNEMGMILQKAGFTLLDEKSDLRPEVVIMGTAIVDWTKTKDIFTAHARVELKASDRKTGDVIAINQQEDNAVAASRDAATRRALETATDELSEKLLPQLAK